MMKVENARRYLLMAAKGQGSTCLEMFGVMQYPPDGGLACSRLFQDCLNFCQ